MLLGVIALLTALAAHAGVVQGIVVEHASGRPLARTIVRLEPVPGSPGRAAQTRASRTGHFIFRAVPNGLYFVVAQREFFFPAAYGQRRPSGRGTPMVVAADSDLFAELRMRRTGVITGRVLDENGVGMPGVNVLAYRARLPLRSVASATSDDRGVYRIPGLDPGKYWVRNAAHTLDDGSGILPTFGPLARELRDARVHEVKVDLETTDANVQPEPGSLFRLSGRVLCDKLGVAVSLTLSSETGRRSRQAQCNTDYMFEGLAPATYEIFGAYADGTGSGFAELRLTQDSALGNVQLMTQPPAELEIRDAESKAVVATAITVVARRDDLSGVDRPMQISLPRPMLSGGHWEMNAYLEQDRYVQSITTNARDARRQLRNERPPEWFDVFVEARAPVRVQILVSPRGGRIAGSAGAPGAPVFLWPVAEEARRSLGGLRQVSADAAGRFTFSGLPPGDYRILSTFDATEADAELFEEAQAKVVTVRAGQTSAVELQVWLAP